mmetsp:Transcript_16513/g.41202  ORF Transcript_16513/g.41202 Transcript_16513/m.41202 type:complete len:235 (-) Transcript_16513:834-1538(-)
MLLTAGSAGWRHLGERLAQHLAARVNLLVRHHQRGHQADDVTLAGRDGQHAQLARRVHHGARHDVQLHATQQAHAAHLLHVRVLAHGAAQPRAQALPLGLHGREERRVRDDVKHGARGVAHQRVARKRGAVVARPHHVRHVLLHEHRADGQAARQWLGQRHHVGRHAVQLVAPQLAGAPQPALHLVKHQQRARIVAQLAQARQELLLRGRHAALALHRLHKHGGGAPLDDHLPR